MAENIMHFFEQKARTGDGQFAIAYALLEIAENGKSIAYALQQIGTGSTNGPGALEFIGMQMREQGEALSIALGRIAGAKEDCEE